MEANGCVDIVGDFNDVPLELLVLGSEHFPSCFRIDLRGPANNSSRQRQDRQQMEYSCLHAYDLASKSDEVQELFQMLFET